MTFGKRQLVIASLVVALGAAVYLNWQFSGTTPVSTTGSEESTVKQLGQTTYVNTEISSVQTDNSSIPASSSKTSGTEKSKLADEGAFADDREKRSKSNAEALEALNDIVEAASSSEAAKKEAVAAVERMAKLIKSQTDLEGQIKAKGFKDVMVSVNNGQCAVSVNGRELDEALVIAIRDLVNRQTGIDFDKITVSAGE